MPVAKSTAKRGVKRAATPASSRPKLLGPVPFPQPPTIAVPALARGVNAEPGFLAVKLPVAAPPRPGGKLPVSGVVFLRGVLHPDPSKGALSGPCPLFTMPPGMHPSHDGFVAATFRDQFPAPVVPIVLGISSNGTVSLLEGEHMGYDSMIWLDGITFLA